MTSNSCRPASRLLAAAVAVTVLNGCASASNNVAAGPSNDADIISDARLLQMADARRLDTLLVDSLLAGANSAIRARATLAIGQVKGKARYGRLQQLLLDADTAVAASAAFALGLVRDTDALYPLARAVAGAPDAVAIEAAWSLGELGDGARSVLLLSLGEGQSEPRSSSTAAGRGTEVRLALITATSKLRNTPVA
ncbi:MAG: hypothetical protein M3Y64_01845, partial [Gemmatimonadota bacterium]|nr:hypothetical protein [Gemmatimonadota bacterium]